jgi:protein O-mannosyl-transferase
MRNAESVEGTGTEVARLSLQSATKKGFYCLYASSRLRVQITYKNKYYLAASAAFATFLVYLPALRNEFVYWDDNLYIFENPYIHSLDAAFFRWAFLDFHISNWHPLTWISHAVDYAIWGLYPLGHHLTNIILHTANTALVVLLALKLLETARESSEQNASSPFLNDRTVLIAAAMTGVLFGIHPVHVESVAWVSERKDLLCALFFLLSVLSYTSFMSYRSQKTYFLSLFFFILALLSKPMAVSLPVVLLILDWYPFGAARSLKSLWISTVEKLPFFTLSLASSIITIIAQKAGGTLLSIDKVPSSIRVPVAAKALVAYLGKILLPINLIPFYPYPKDVSLFSFEYFLAICLVIGITAACMALARKQKFLLSAWGYYVVTLIPVLGIIQVGAQSMADRYTYLPGIGPFLIAGLCAAWVAERVNAVKSPRLITKAFSVIVVLLLGISLSYATNEQIAIWRNSISLWSYVMEKEPERVPIAYNNRGLVYYKTGQFDKAIADFHKAVTLKPSYIDAYSNLGMAFFKIARFDEAIVNFDKAIALDPAYYKAYNNRALAFGAMGKFDKAVEDYNRVITLKPSSPQAYYNLGVLHAQAGFFDQAIKYFSQTIAVDSEYVDAYNSRGITYSLLNQFDRALDDFARALSLNQNPVAVYMNRGNLYVKYGREDLAVADFQKACALGDEAGCSLANKLIQGLP